MNQEALEMAHTLIADAEAAARRAQARGDMISLHEAVAVRRLAEHYAQIAIEQDAPVTTDRRLS